MFNRLTRFLNIIGDNEYVLCGSGSCAENVLQIICDNNLTQPTRIVDDVNINKSISGLPVTAIDINIDGMIVLCATLDFALEMRLKLKQKASPLTVFALCDFCNKTIEKKAKSKYPIVINTIPKCGNAFIFNTLQSSLNSEFCDISAGPWSNMLISERNLSKAIKKDGFVVDHFNANKYNIGMLNDFNICRIVFHSRDPRQATLSWMHWIDKKHREGRLNRWENPPNQSYFKLSTPAKIDILIEYWLPTLCAYISDWVMASNGAGLSIKFTDFETMVDKPMQFYRDIYDFFEVEASHRKLVLPERENMHFRKGLKDEWKDVFSPEQRLQANKCIPMSLAIKMGWEL